MRKVNESLGLVVFDWDGTLLDSVASIVDCTQRALKELDQPPVEAQRIRSAIGLGLREIVERFAPGCDDALFHQIVEVYGKHWFATYGNQSVLFPGVPELLDRLGQKGVLLAVATAKGRRGLEMDLERTGLTGFFHASRTVDEARSKPHPQMLLDILKELGMRAGESLMVGDTVHDLQMAGNAGISCVAVASGTESRLLLAEQAPLACLENVGELEAWLSATGLLA